jgi:hypothetical protein
MCLIRSDHVAMLMAFSLIVLCASPSRADLYEWTDADGRVHYTNEPRSGSSRVGLAPVALESEQQESEVASDAKRRERLKRQRAEDWVARQDGEKARGLDGAWVDPDGHKADRPAALAPPDESPRAVREGVCQESHGMSCRQFKAWKRAFENDCNWGPAGAGCRPTTENDGDKQKGARNVEEGERSERDKSRMAVERDRAKRDAAARHRDALHHGR